MGDASGASGVSVGEKCKGVWVAIGAVCVGGFAFLAATVSATIVSATAVWMPVISCVASGVLFALQAVMNKDVITIVTKSVYFIDLNIFSFHSMEIIILLNRNARFSRALCFMFENGSWTGE